MSTNTNGTISTKTDDCEWPSTISESPAKATEPNQKRKKIATLKNQKLGASSSTSGCRHFKLTPNASPEPIPLADAQKREIAPMKKKVTTMMPKVKTKPGNRSSSGHASPSLMIGDRASSRESYGRQEEPRGRRTIAKDAYDPYPTGNISSRQSGQKLINDEELFEALEREIRPPEPIADISDPSLRAELREPQPSLGINSALGSAFNTAGQSNNTSLTESNTIVLREPSHPDVSALQTVIEQMNQASANNLYMLRIAQNSENSMHHSWLQAAHQMREEMGIANVNARTMAIKTIQSESDCETYKRLCEEVGEEAHRQIVLKDEQIVELRHRADTYEELAYSHGQYAEELKSEAVSTTVMLRTGMESAEASHASVVSELKNLETIAMAQQEQLREFQQFKEKLPRAEEKYEELKQFARQLHSQAESDRFSKEIMQQELQVACRHESQDSSTFRDQLCRMTQETKIMRQELQDASRSESQEHQRFLDMQQEKLALQREQQNNKGHWQHLAKLESEEIRQLRKEVNEKSEHAQKEMQTLRDTIFNWEAWYEGQQYQQEYGYEEQGEEELQSEPDEEVETDDSAETQHTDVEVIPTSPEKQERGRKMLKDRGATGGGVLAILNDKDVKTSRQGGSKSRERKSSVKSRATAKTKLSRRAERGDFKIEVDSIDGFKIGQRIRIGDDYTEKVTIYSFGSIKFVTALKMSHDAGTTVIALKPKKDPAKRGKSKQSSSENDDSDSSNDSSSKGKIAKYKIGTVEVPKLPRRRHEVEVFFMNLSDAIMKASTRIDDKERLWINEVKSWKSTGVDATPDYIIDDLPIQMVPLDRTLKTSLMEQINAHDRRLYGEVQALRARLNAQNPPEIIRTRRILMMICENLASDTNLLEVATITDLNNLNYDTYGDKKAHIFYEKYLGILHRMSLPLPVEHRRDLLYAQLRKSEGLKFDLRDYEKTPEAERTFDQIIKLFKDWIDRCKVDRNLRREFGDSSNKKEETRIRKPRVTALREKNDNRQCSYCGMKGHTEEFCRKKKQDYAQKGKGKGKGKGRGKGKGKGRGNPKGKGKGKGTWHNDHQTKGKGKGKGKGIGKGKNNHKGKGKGKGKDAKGKGKGKGKPSPPPPPQPHLESKPRIAAAFAKRAKGAICKFFDKCPGRHDGGDGTCHKLHMTSAEAQAHIGKDKAKVDKVKAENRNRAHSAHR